MMNFLVAVSGHAGVGKDTVADYMTNEWGFVKVGLADPLKRICRDVFEFSNEQLWGPSEKRNEPDKRYVRMKAGALGTTFVGDTDLSGTQFAGYEHLVKDGHLPSPLEDVYLTPRYALQTLGTEWGRDCCNDIWIRYGINTAKAIMAGATYSSRSGIVSVDDRDAAGVVFSDLRFRNEFEEVRKSKGFLIRIHRKEAEGKLSGGVAGHASEAEQDSVSDDFFDAVIHNDGSFEELYERVDSVLRIFQKEITFSESSKKR